tara:strand:+ start:474 stop:650 length:177 start_codon:yes stop_codon:yes gene_type:complete
MFGNCWEIEFSPLVFALASFGEFFNEVNGDELFIDVVTEELFVATEELFVAFVAMIKV